MIIRDRAHIAISRKVTTDVARLREIHTVARWHYRRDEYAEALDALGAALPLLRGEPLDGLDGRLSTARTHFSSRLFSKEANISSIEANLSFVEASIASIADSKAF